MQTLSINVTRIDRTGIYPGKNGKYLNLVLFENKAGRDSYGNDGFVTQDLGRERRQAGEKGPILGNWRRIDPAPGGTRPLPMPPTPTAPGQDMADDDIPF